jgi:hypothetical protein
MALIENHAIDLGDDVGIDYSATKKNANGTRSPYDATGKVIVFSLSKTQPANASFLFQKRSDNGGITITNPVGVIGTINVLGTDQVGLAPGIYFYDVVSMNPDGTGKRTLTKGRFGLDAHPNS